MRSLRLLGAMAIVAAAGWFAAEGRWPWHRLDDSTSVADVRVPTVVEESDTLRRGETLGVVLARHGIADLDLARVLPALDPRRLRAGLPLRFVKPQAGQPATELHVRADGRRFTVQRVANGWRTVVQPVVWRSEPLRVAGTIRQTLFDALDEAVPSSTLDAGNRAALAYALADVFAWQLDFTKDIQRGDRFAVLVEREISDDGEIRLGRVLAGDLTTGNRRVTAFSFSAAGRASFYDENGNSLRRAFLAAPVEFRRISSGFSRARFHPVLGRFRAHEGTDYAASPGTPVMAAGDGLVLRAGWSGGYGNLIELRHANGVTTRYGHLSRIAAGVRPGARVGQGQTIGFVGTTGLSTGPHLHYEFRVNGVPQDFAKVDRGVGVPLPPAERAAFAAERARLEALLHPELSAPATASR